ncbi:hypothetical protein NL676_004930 [Syzygium grande]|nr:hypothetical protein NL676_004930 [Syzygium grande]
MARSADERMPPRGQLLATATRPIIPRHGPICYRDGQSWPAYASGWGPARSVPSAAGPMTRDSDNSAGENLFSHIKR